MNTVEVKVWLLRNNLGMNDIAKILGVTQPHISMVIHNHRQSGRIEKGLARLGCPKEHLGIEEPVNEKEERNAA